MATLYTLVFYTASYTKQAAVLPIPVITSYSIHYTKLYESSELSHAITIASFKLNNNVSFCAFKQSVLNKAIINNTLLIIIC